MMAEAVLINCFEVPADRAEEFLDLWGQANDLLRDAGGYRSTRLHQALAPDARYSFVNVAELDSVETWRSVITGPQFQALSERMADFHPTPGLYRIAVADDPGSPAAR
jgi:heme-degrading monooxygenase HmoA